MSRPRYTVTVRGTRHEWVFDAGHPRPEYVEQWRADGLVVDQVEAEIPGWVWRLGLATLWWRVQDRLRGWDVDAPMGHG